ncbi:hypothetical protein [Flavobacterium hydatis]|jgi:hypothetical protein|uniref:Beta-carotene 15,15'-monooxygenase n=1 Tax=Flavobacterium hydatis TaxID=991 RepID=A0A086AFU2_FLAHY|nr:hypothetical protein [Flavobacterium hydatis]KFF15556.1 hypothetical protein IW20_13820 [Flavobacterium hydatis]OXA89860.1 hypothetical protein B0A62_20155 [Flavobacterium hydatis]
MKELDLLKKDWNKTANTFQQVSEVEIYNMIHKKSSSIVKWILVISLLEILFWTISNFVFSIDDFLKQINHPEYILYLEVITYFNYVVVLIFVYFFYKNYTTISTTKSTKLLMSSILKTRKTVQYYVWYNLAMAVITSIISFFIAFSSPEMNYLKEKIATNGTVMLMVIGILVLVTLFFLGLFWCFYRLIYGTLLRRLYANYKELKKIDL